MGAAPDYSTIGNQDLVELFQAARIDYDNDNGDAEFLDQADTPTLDAILANAEAANPALSVVARKISGKRSSAMQIYSGTDKLRFDRSALLYELKYGMGMCHLGEEVPLQEFEEAGVQVRYDANLTSSGKVLTTLRPEAKGAIINLAKVKMRAFMENYRTEVNALFLLSNASLDKCWGGFDAHAPVTSNSAGEVGQRSRSDPSLRHQLLTGLTASDIEKRLTAWARNLRDNNVGARSPYWMACGNDFFGLLDDVVLTKFNRQLAVDKAQEEMKRWKIGMPDDAYFIPGLGTIVRDPSFADLDRRDPGAAVPWAKRLIAIPKRTMRLKKARHAEVVPHPIPYDQGIWRCSLFGKYGWVNWAPGRVGVACAA